MYTALTHQSAQYQGNDILIINGEKSIFSGRQRQIEAQQRIKRVMMSHNKEKLPRFCKVKGASQSLAIFITDSEELVVSSNYQTKDENGRHISYDYYCDSIESPEKMGRLLSDDSRLAGMIPNPADIKVLEKYLTFRKNKSRYYAIIGCTTVVVLFLIIKAAIYIVNK